MVRFLILAVSLWLLGGLVGCNSPQNPLSGPTTLEATLTQLDATRTPLPETKFSATPQPSVVPSRSPTPSNVLPPADTQVPNPTITRPCNLAAAGRPIDVTVPDEARMNPGESFVKTWRLVNAGSCAWSRGYSAVWFSGANLSSNREEPLRGIVSPDQSVEISIDMSAPETAGIYQSNWKLRDEKGNLFGIGPAGNSPFWVRIEVVVLETSTPGTPTATETPVPVILRSGDTRLIAGEKFDLDTGSLGPGSGDDLWLKISADQFEWSPQNGSRITVFGVNPPSPLECRALDVPASPVLFGSELEGQYLCIFTDQNLPGSVRLTNIDLARNTIDIHYLVWTLR